MRYPQLSLLHGSLYYAACNLLYYVLGYYGFRLRRRAISTTNIVMIIGGFYAAFNIGFLAFRLFQERINVKNTLLGGLSLFISFILMAIAGVLMWGIIFLSMDKETGIIVQDGEKYIVEVCPHLPNESAHEYKYRYVNWLLRSNMALSEE